MTSIMGNDARSGWRSLLAVGAAVVTACGRASSTSSLAAVRSGRLEGPARSAGQSATQRQSPDFARRNQR